MSKRRRNASKNWSDDGRKTWKKLSKRPTRKGPTRVSFSKRTLISNGKLKRLKKNSSGLSLRNACRWRIRFKSPKNS